MKALATHRFGCGFRLHALPGGITKSPETNNRLGLLMVRALRLSSFQRFSVSEWIASLDSLSQVWGRSNMRLVTLSVCCPRPESA